MELLIKTLAGLEEVLATELQALGAHDIDLRKRAVACQGDLTFLYRANLELRTALRVLVVIDRFSARDEADVYNGIRRTDWTQYLHAESTLAVDAVSFLATLNHNHYLALKCKDAVVDQIREKTGQRPSVDVYAPDLRLNLHISGTGQCTLSLDSSGDSLHRRGYRQATGQAPLNEVLAAGLIALTGWAGDTPFVDPLCGSGTLLIEAAHVAKRQPPNWLRTRYGFQKWSNYDSALWQSIRDAVATQLRPLSVPIVGGDRDSRVLESAQENITAAKLPGIELRKTSFQQLDPPPGPGLLLTNPPYDLRMQTADIAEVYRALGDKMKQDFAGYTAWVFSGNPAALKRVGLRPSRKLTLFNGPLECRYYRYDLYAGSKKDKGGED